jgi:hypothetical protein
VGRVLPAGCASSAEVPHDNGGHVIGVEGTSGDGEDELLGVIDAEDKIVVVQ